MKYLRMSVIIQAPLKGAEIQFFEDALSHKTVYMNGAHPLTLKHGIVVPMDIVPDGNRIWTTSFIDPTALINGKIMLDGDFIYIAPFVELDSLFGGIRIGEGTNIQDGASLKGPAEIGCSVSIAHKASISNSSIGNFCFIGFGAEIKNSRIGAGAFISHGAKIESMNVQEGGYVPPGGSRCEGEISEALKDFKEEVLHVNSELVIGYIDLLYAFGERALLQIAPSPKTSWAKTYQFPEADSVRTLGPCRIIGGIFFAGEGEVGERTSIRGDEGYPIRFGKGVRIGQRSVFHSLKGAGIEVGKNASIGNDTVIHGPAKIGNNALVGNRCIILKSTIAEGEVVPDGSVIIERHEK
uniref:Uncharacterized protein n=1 Tax=Candidatus Methanomethylicus mesodigestus TaxID=1867258 RepID=A0A7C3J221_9CREN